MKQKGLTLILITLALILLAFPAFSETGKIKVGAMFISSGPMGGYGKHANQAIQLAVEEINAGGGIMGKSLEVIVEDTTLKKEVVQSLSEKFINAAKVDFLMGPTSSGLAMMLTQIAKENENGLMPSKRRISAGLMKN